LIQTGGQLHTEYTSFFKQKRGAIRKQRAVIQKILDLGPATVTDIAEQTDLAKNLIVWNLIGMLRWGMV
jgi:hypothetical protein